MRLILLLLTLLLATFGAIFTGLFVSAQLHGAATVTLYGTIACLLMFVLVLRVRV